MRLVQIAPEYDPPSVGAGCYPIPFATQLHHLGIATTFAAPARQRQPQSAGAEELSGNSLFAPRPPAPAEQLDVLCPNGVLVRYSGYDCAKRGAPVWLVRGLPPLVRPRPPFQRPSDRDNVSAVFTP